MRKSAEGIPPAQIASGKCRLRINEINIYPSGSQQFLELIRICESDPGKVYDVTMEDQKKKQSLYKLAFITHASELIGVCDLRGKASTRHSNFVFYTIGAEAYAMNLEKDMSIQDCNFAADYFYTISKGRFPTGDVAPIGVALVYNQSPSVIAPISLDVAGSSHKTVKIDMLLKKKIIENIQDFLVYSSSSPYSDCESFKEYYSEYNTASGYYIVRDWGQTEDQFDYGRSRCPTPGASSAWLPFHSKEYFYAPSSPNRPNVCEKKVRFVIEEYQEKRLVPLKEYPTPSSKFSCDILTEDNSIERLHTISDPIVYGEKLTSVIRESLSQLSKAVQAIAPPTPRPYSPLPTPISFPNNEPDCSTLAEGKHG